MYQQIACIPTGDHRGDKRFPDNISPPKLRGWRCNLTALSHQYNLYFLASVDVVHVYQPTFPDQNLSSEAELVLHPPRSGAIGYGIDPSNPHSITHILVDYLGNEEILFLACDDGDVCVYRTQEIYRALERRTNLQEPANEDGVHVFLRSNVGASAWGLAVHREARMIAVSANTHQITILAFALASDSERDVSDHDTHESSSRELRFPYDRQKDDVLILEATNNVPALSFYGDSGRWLLSNCIDGKTSLWDLYTMKEVATFRLGWCANAMDLLTPPHYNQYRFLCDCPAARNIIHGAWGTIALDTRSAYELSSDEELSLGLRSSSDAFLDVTDQKKRFSVSKRIYSHAGPSGHQSDSDITDDEEHDTDDEQQTQINAQFAQATDATQLSLNELLQSALGQMAMDYITQSRTAALKPYRVIEYSRPVIQPIASPFLIFTKEEVFLIQGPFKTSINHPMNQIVAMRRPLHPGPWVDALQSQDRHCFFAQISELGVFIVGSPIGHAGVFSLYYTKDESHEGPRYGFKLEYLLPFQSYKETEIAGVPQGRLLGVAVAPVQGMLDTLKDAQVQEQELPQPRRWRVLMYYTSHAVLSFELSKRREGESPCLGDLVV